MMNSHQSMMDTMTEEEYAFYLAYGVSNDTTLQLQELLDELLTDVEM